jgi:hypothetical protein
MFTLVAAALAVPARQAAAQPEFGREVDAAINRAVEFLWSQQQKNNGSFENDQIKFPNAFAYHTGGQSALVAYALLESGVSPQDKRMKGAINYLGKTGMMHTYNLGIRANVWQVANRNTADKYLKPLKKDAGLLAKMSVNGHYSYGVGGGADSWDNSNSQYGVLGMWAAALNDLDVRSSYWKAVRNHWRKVQHADGGWGYTAAGNSTATMTAGGIATLFICEDNLPPSEAVINCQGATIDPSLKRGLAWQGGQFQGMLFKPAQIWYYYYLYGVERSALASGYKYFGGLDWYRAGARELMKQQQKGGGPFSGAWVGVSHHKLEGGGLQQAKHGEIIVDTAFALLYLIRGRQPVLFNKLQFEGDWHNRPRDMAAVTRWASRNFEENVNWQIIPLDTAVTEWRDAPMMYISGHAGLSFAGPLDPAVRQTFDEENLRKLRTYVNQGGTLVSVTEADGDGFADDIRRLYKKLYPDYKLTKCPPGHKIYECYDEVSPEEATFYILSNGIRPLAIHTDQDLSLKWQIGHKKNPAAFKAAANVIMYVIDNFKKLPARGTNTWLSAPDIPGSSDAGPAPRRHLASHRPPGQFLAAKGKVDFIIIAVGGQHQIVSGDMTGKKGKVGDVVITVPDPDAPGRVTVIHPKTKQTINIPEDLLGFELYGDDNFPPFVAKRPTGGVPDSGGGSTGGDTGDNGGSRKPAQPRRRVAIAGGRATIVRLRHGANWDPEPLAYERFVSLMADKANTNVNVNGPVDIADLPGESARLAVMTGTEKLTLTDAEMAAIKKYVEGGGTLFVDAGGGSKAFYDSLKTLLAKMYPTKQLKKLATQAPIYQIPGAQIEKVRYRRRTMAKLQTSKPNLHAILFDDRAGIIVSKEDVTGGLVGYQSYAVDGYMPVSAFEILRNVVLYAGR